MKRITITQKYINKIISRIDSILKQRETSNKAYGTAQCCSMIASKRGLDVELAYICGLLHDAYTIFTGSAMCHAESGADMVRVALKKMDIFSKEEIKLLSSAIFYHSRKDLVHDDFHEAIKDGDVLYAYMKTSDPIPSRYVNRIEQLFHEFDFTYRTYEVKDDEIKEYSFNRSRMADFAGEMALNKVTGERDDSDFMDIIKYYPEDSAFHELKSSWCAAAVYHCALKAGLEIPMRMPPYDVRFAGVGTWYLWGNNNGFCHYEKDGFTPEKGDIIIFNNIIPPENKLPNSPWHDHIGVVLSCEGDYVTAVEGNIDNLNKAGITKRKRDHTIGCYIRIPNGFQHKMFTGDYMEYLKDKV